MWRNFWYHQCEKILHPLNLKTEVSFWKRIKCSPSTLCRRNSKTQRSPVILYLCLRKTRSGESNDYRNVTVFEKLCFQNVFRPREIQQPVFWNSSGLMSVFEKLRFRGALVCTVGLTIEKKLRFQISLAGRSLDRCPYICANTVTAICHRWAWWQYGLAPWMQFNDALRVHWLPVGSCNVQDTEAFEEWGHST